MPPRHDQGTFGLAMIAGTGTVILIMLAVLIGAGAGFDQTQTGPCQTQPAPTATAATTIPATYLTLYRQAGRASGVPWNMLAGIGEVESDHGRSTAPGVHNGANFAGAMGPMQFLAATWTEYGNNGNAYNPADAIPAAARYLKANGAPENPSKAIFAYNHSADYVSTVQGWATRYAQQPTPVLTSTDDTTCTQTTANPAPRGAAAQIVDYALTQLGKPYIWGGTGPEGFDCSGLAMMAYRSAGITIPRLANSQYFHGPPIPTGHEQPGDLVFFAGSDGTQTDPGHVGIVYNTANKTMVVAPHTGTEIQIQSYRSYPGGVVGFTRPATDTTTSR